MTAGASDHRPATVARIASYVVAGIVAYLAFAMLAFAIATALKG